MLQKKSQPLFVLRLLLLFAAGARYHLLYHIAGRYLFVIDVVGKLNTSSQMIGEDFSKISVF